MRDLDGLADTVTIGRLAIEPGWKPPDLDRLDQRIRPVVEAALGDIGAAEDPPGSNRGAAIDKFAPGGLPWCAFALSTWFAAAPGGCPWRRLGSAYKIHRWAIGARALVPTGEPLRVGDVAITTRTVQHGDGRRIVGHVGLIVGVLDNGRLCTVEGNAGDAVRALVRDRGEFKFYARPIP